MLEIDYQTLATLQELKSEKAQIEEEANRLSKVALTDVSLIPTLYQWYKRIQKEEIRGGKVGTRKFKKQFVFLILYLYSPETLAGGDRIVRGVRPALAKLLGFRSPGGISNLCSDLLFLYTTYEDFHWEIDHIYTCLIEKLKEEGYLPEYFDNQIETKIEHFLDAI